MTLNGWLAGVVSVGDATCLDDENQAQWEQEQSKGRTTRRDPVRWLR